MITISFATPVMENPGSALFPGSLRQLQVVIPNQFHRRDVNRQTLIPVAMIDADSSILGVYRTHIPDDHLSGKILFHQEILVLRYLIQLTGKVGVGICWDSGFRRLPELWQWKAPTLKSSVSTAIGRSGSIFHWRLRSNRRRIYRIGARTWQNGHLCGNYSGYHVSVGWCDRSVAACDGDVFCGGGTGKMDDGTSGDLS